MPDITYTRPYSGGWRDSPDTATPITASALDAMDAGIEAATAQANAALSAAESVTPPVASVNGKTGAIVLAAADVGADAAGSASAAQAAAEAASVPLASVGAAGGVAGLDAGGLLPKDRLPNVLRSDYKFAPEDYTDGAANVIFVSDAAMNSGSAVVTCDTSQPFTSTSADEGKPVYVVGAGAGGADYYGTIVAVQSHSQATLSANAGTTVTGKGCAFGSDAGAQIRQAVTDAYAFMASSRREAALVLNGSGYGVAGALSLGGSTLGNAMFPLAPVPVAGTKARLRLAGNADASALLHWQQEMPQMNGPTIVVLRPPAAVDPTYGPPSVFGGPFAGYGAAESVFSNMQVVLDGVSVALPWDSGFTGFDFYGLAEAVVRSGSALAMATVPGGAWPVITDFGALTRTAAGLRMPDTNNNDRSDIDYWSCEGLVYSAALSEHVTWRRIAGIYNFVAAQVYAGASMPHAMDGGYLSAEACGYAVGVMPSGVAGFPGGNTVKTVIRVVDLESAQLLNDPDNLMSGKIGVTGNYTPAYGAISVNGGAGVKIYDLMHASGIHGSPPAVPASGTPLANLYYADETVNVQPAGATITAIAVDGTTLTGITSGPVRVPSGRTIALTYSGGTPEWQWTAD